MLWLRGALRDYGAVQTTDLSPVLWDSSSAFDSFPISSEDQAAKSGCYEPVCRQQLFTALHHYSPFQIRSFFCLFPCSSLNSRNLQFQEKSSSDNCYILVKNPEFWLECQLFLLSRKKCNCLWSFQVHTDSPLHSVLYVWLLGSCFAVPSLFQTAWGSGWTKSVYKTMKDSTMTKRNSGKLVSCKCLVDFTWSAYLLDPPWSDGEIHLMLKTMVREMKGSIVTCEPYAMIYGLRLMEPEEERSRIKLFCWRCQVRISWFNLFQISLIGESRNWWYYPVYKHLENSWDSTSLSWTLHYWIISSFFHTGVTVTCEHTSSTLNYYLYHVQGPQNIQCHHKVIHWGGANVSES